MTSQKDNLHKVAQDFSLIDQYFPRNHQYTEAGLGLTMGCTTTTRYPEYEAQNHVRFQNSNCHYWRPQARTVLLEPVVAINSSDHVYQVHHVAKANHANQMETEGQNRRNSYQVPPAAARPSRSNFGGWRFRQGQGV